MTDLIYDEKAMPAIKARFPHAMLMDASDEVHEGRFQVVLPDGDRDAFYKHLMREGDWQASLHFGLMMVGGRKEDKATIERWMAELEVEKRG